MNAGWHYRIGGLLGVGAIAVLAVIVANHPLVQQISSVVERGGRTADVGAGGSEAFTVELEKALAADGNDDTAALRSLFQLGFDWRSTVERTTEVLRGLGTKR
jgi:hypothetical protein